MTDTLKTTPLMDCTIGRLDDVRSEWWCWSLRHYEEGLADIVRLNQHREPHAVILHMHRHGLKCNEQCALVEPTVVGTDAPIDADGGLTL